MKINRILKQLFVAGALVAGIGQAHAGVVTFSGLVDREDYSEAGMNMAADGSVWNWPAEQMAHMDDGTAIFQLASGNVFDLNSVDMIADGGTGTARIAAYLDGTLLGWTDVLGTAGTYAFGTLFQGIDEFRISFVDDHFTFDNLVFTEESSEVPEPTGIALLGIGAAALLARRRKAA